MNNLWGLALLLHAGFVLVVLLYKDWPAHAVPIALVFSLLSFLLLALNAFSSSSLATPTTVKKMEDEQKFFISIIDVRVHNGKVEYLLRGQYNAFVWTTWKRYSLLRKLKPFLTQVGGEGESSFPPKTSIGTNTFDLRFVQERRRLLGILFAKRVDKDFFENGIPDSVREEALGVPVDAIHIEKALLSPEDVHREANAVVELALQATKVEPNEWTKYGKNSRGNVSGYLKEEGTLTFVLGQGTIDRFNKDQVFAYLTNAAHRAEWDENYKSETLLESIPQLPALPHGFRAMKVEVFRTTTNSPAKQFVAERDSVCLAVQARRESDGALLHLFRSVPHSKAPAGMDGYVRAQVFCAGFVLQDRLDGKPGCLLTSIGMVDPVGNIPKWVINLALKNNTWQPWTIIESKSVL